MKSVLMAALLLSLSAGAQARSILVFKTVTKCETAQKVEGSELKVDVQEAQDGQAQLVINLSGDDEAIKVQAKKILPPPMSAGTPLKYVGSDPKTHAQVTLAIGTRPIKVGKVTGRTSSITVEKLFSNLPMVCSSVK
ncbi:hypothetical protein DOM21_05025 [Bacteriovorax stolpii]|uniref:Uncharacterized protein n=1 Tax=Bacteriovorax stolpii TaxID=960 RepID=A0A2K9NUK4_BACTC|nr:hypothetical protein [Bacteriovorax stolpii]AUN99190.1 hypothetical protein C0V70_13975 [Bacteriovorax stolpii]QDK40828.1 hypothetical protein DOM21_05025 [Bacteriovorax stolpii]TDP55272.1 hypothetical protein C8D79_0317 [Bacteriovorax stolpii]